MRRLIVACLFLMACGRQPVAVANDFNPRYCSDKYPFEAPPDLCESNSYGDCCTWEMDNDGGTCRYDYCSYFGTDPGECEWELQYSDCE